MKNNKLLFSVIVCFFLAFLVVGSVLKKGLQPINVLSTVSTISTFKVEQKIINGNANPKEVKTLEVKEGDTVLDLLIKTKNPEIKEYPFGKAVESIDGIKNGTDKKYWLYSVNGKEANVGAGDYKLTQDDKVVWERK